MTWRELAARVDAAGLGDVPLGHLHVVIEEDGDEASIEIFKAIDGTLTVANAACR